MNNKDDLWARIMSDYRCQIAAIDGMKEAMGDAFVDPREHKGTNVEGGGGRYVSLKKTTQRGVPKGVFTIPYLLHRVRCCTLDIQPEAEVARCCT